ncbi:hypothetical protein RhiirA1_473231 [Rhizophagus irregularis]|uniref:DUF7869 domain-containing protein n=1 Tax=Rhizophagus irregularis TaxID=588596 RepID=A0A2N0R0Y5_9GLOM|nr:hypothetical protein RhiirA1_473231 [Rhizophagus irregularis]
MDLKNTYFIKNSDSDNEKSTSDGEIEVASNNDYNDIENLEENFEEMCLNDFKFTENYDNYIKDKIYDELKLKKNCRFKYCFNNSLPICRITYENLVGIGHIHLDNLIKHFREYGLKERIHGNTGRSPKNMNRVEINYGMSCEIYNFLKNYSDIHGLLSPGRKFSKISMPVVFLPTSYSYASVYRDYIQAYKNEYGEEIRVIAESTFHIQYATEHEKKLAITEKYLTHLNRAKQERDYYNNNIKHAVEDGKCNPNTTGSQILFKSFEDSLHIAPQKVHLFGVCNTGNFPYTEQTNYIIDEAEMPDDGKQGKGVNCTLSLVWHAILKYNRGEKKLVITCDNCVGQNKNNYSLFFYSWLIDRGLYEEIELNFMIPGHTKFICDSCFGLIKVLYRKSKTTFKGTKNYLTSKNKHHFYFTSQHPGVIFYKDKLKDDYKKATVRNFPFDFDILPSTINIRPLSLKRQKELYKEITPYVDTPFRDIMILLVLS